MRRPVFLILCLLALPITLRAQWQRVGPMIIHPTYGAIHYKSGTLWAGGQELYRSRDFGTSWEKIVFPDQSGITDICFLNADTGIVATLTDLYQTYDHGITWRGVARDKYQYMRVAYIYSSLNIFAMA